VAQNTSHAVMAQRVEPHDSLDHFPTPPWATRALFEHVLFMAAGDRIWEPACGDGSMFRPIMEYASEGWASDVHDYGWDHIVHDFLNRWMPKEVPLFPDWIVTNPPFRLAEQFVQHGLECGARGVAVLVRSVFIESIGRYKNLFEHLPPTSMAQFTERVPMVKGRLDKNASTATSYCWLVWEKAEIGKTPRLQWIPPCRSRLELSGDYP
jgi:hypothetical protein